MLPTTKGFYRRDKLNFQIHYTSSTAHIVHKHKSKQTSTSATNEAAIVAKASPASNVGAPHWKGYGILILI